MKILNNEKNIRTSRRGFIHLFGWSLASGSIFSLMNILKKEHTNNSNISISLKELEYKPVLLNDKIIIIKNIEKYYVFENKCTHLGCKLKAKDNSLICPCHGSKFSLDGVPTNGPAIDNLRKLNYLIKNDNIVVDLS